MQLSRYNSNGLENNRNETICLTKSCAEILKKGVINLKVKELEVKERSLQWLHRSVVGSIETSILYKIFFSVYSFGKFIFDPRGA